MNASEPIPLFNASTMAWLALMFGTGRGQFFIGLPGNPVSSLVCTRVFVRALLRAMLGQPPEALTNGHGRLGADVGENGPRTHFMRAIAQPPVGSDACELDTVAPVRSQDSSLLTPLALADVLIVRSPGDAAQAAGTVVDILRLDF